VEVRKVSDQEATGRIKIVKIPGGEAPDEVRAAWVGLVLPCYPIACRAPRIGVLSGKQRLAEGQWSALVPQEDAIEILGRHKPFAAEWWHEAGFPHPFFNTFTFNMDDVEIVSGVTYQPIVEVTDEMQGDPDR